MTGVGLLLMALSGIGLLRPLENASYVLIAPLEAALRSVARPIADGVTNYGDLRALTNENANLRTENERLNAEIARLQEEATRNEQLQRLLDVKNALADQTFVAAGIFADEPGNLRQVVAINRGKDDGMQVGMPVVTEGQTLVGTITKVESDHAWVTLVTDVDSAVSAVVLESRAAGVVAGGYNRQLTMEFVTQDSAVKANDTIVTSGLGGRYPAGLVIGKVTGVSGDRQEVFRRVSVEPLASLARLENVLVMTSFVPIKLATP